MSQQSEEQKVVLITGAAKGIGRASAEKLMDEGWIVYGGDIAFDEMLDLERRGMHRLKMDVCSDEQVLDGVAKISAEQGRIDGVLANAGYTCMGMFELVSIEEAKKQYEVNVFGLARTVKAVLAPHAPRSARRQWTHRPDVFSRRQSIATWGWAGIRRQNMLSKRWPMPCAER